MCVSCVVPLLSPMLIWRSGRMTDGCFRSMFTLIAGMLIREEASHRGSNRRRAILQILSSDKPLQTPEVLHVAWPAQRKGAMESKGCKGQGENLRKWCREKGKVWRKRKKMSSSYSNSSGDSRVEPWKQLSVLNASSCALAGSYRFTSNHQLSHWHTHPFRYKLKRTILKLNSSLWSFA